MRKMGQIELSGEYEIVALKLTPAAIGRYNSEPRAHPSDDKLFKEESLGHRPCAFFWLPYRRSL